MSPCGAFRWRLFEPSLSVIVLAICRQLAVEEEAIGPAFVPIAFRERARCFLISFAKTIKVTGSIFNRSFGVQFRVQPKSLRHCSEDGRHAEEPSAAGTSLHERGRISAWTTSRPIAAELMLNTCKTDTLGGARVRPPGAQGM